MQNSNNGKTIEISLPINAEALRQLVLMAKGIDPANLVLIGFFANLIAESLILVEGTAAEFLDGTVVNTFRDLKAKLQTAYKTPSYRTVLKTVEVSDEKDVDNYLSSWTRSAHRVRKMTSSKLRPVVVSSE
ncbi:MAG: hypothetical protein L6Q98_16780 [Anaerolineae bacterium]|nr:hypothetical protein [Anaerolineae bacterium]NUQ03906.1 hypothetical protein [Anaerolineae bacterium]